MHQLAVLESALAEVASESAELESALAMVPESAPLAELESASAMVL